MSSFGSLTEAQIKERVAKLVDANDTAGLVDLANAVAALPSAPESQHNTLVAGAVGIGEAAFPKLGESDPSEDLIQCIINSCDVLIRGTVEAARSNPRFKIPLGKAQVSARETLSMAYDVSGRYLEAARTLAEMPLDSGLPSFEEDYKFSLWVMLAELQLKAGNEIQAENYLNTARPLERSPKIQPGARDRFNLCYAQVLDSSKKYVESANRYLIVSAGVADSDALEALRRATVCATMAEPCEARHRVLGALYRNDLRPKLGEIGLVIEKLFHTRVLRKVDIEALRALLLTQHNAKSADGTTAFDLAIVRHNVVSASKIYAAITFTDLAALLGVSAEAAEQTAALMAAQGRISAKIDQLQGTVSFTGNAAVPILRWDAQIDTVGNLIASVADTIVHRHPEMEPKGGL